MMNRIISDEGILALFKGLKLQLVKAMLAQGLLTLIAEMIASKW